jgi:hypothetical protein
MKSSFIVTKTVFFLVIALLIFTTGKSKGLVKFGVFKAGIHKTNKIYYAASKRDNHGLGVYYRYDPAIGRKAILADFDTVNGKERTPLSTRLAMNQPLLQTQLSYVYPSQVQKEFACKRNECC